MEETKNKKVNLLVGAALAMCCGSANALPVHIQVDRGDTMEYGAGYSVGRGSECLIVTPLHVVEDASADEITITDADGRHANAQLIKSSLDFDAALLKVQGAVNIACPEDWDDGVGSAKDIDGAEYLTARKIGSNGRTEQNRLFVSASTNEQLELEPMRDRDMLAEGDSGTSLYADKRLVGMVLSVDPKSGDVFAVTQSQLHGLFGMDVLPTEERSALVYPILYRNKENVYATNAAYQYIGAMTPLVLMEPVNVDLRKLANNQLPPPPADVDFVVTGTIVAFDNKREANPHYKPNAKESNFASELFRNMKNSATGRNEDSRYLRIFNVDVEISVEDVASNSRVRNLERRSYTIPEDGANVRELEKSVMATAVADSMHLTFQKNRLPLK